MNGTFSFNCDYNKIRDIPTFTTYIFKKWRIFFSFFLYFFIQESVISIGDSINCIMMYGVGCIVESSK